FDVAPDRGYRVSPCSAVPGKPGTQHGDGRAGAWPQPCPRHRLVSVALFLGRASATPGRLLAATLLCGVRTFLDTVVVPRSPGLPYNTIITCDNTDILVLPTILILWRLI